MIHKLSNYDIEEIKANMNNLEDLITAVGFIVRQSYDGGYTDGYTEGYHDACMKEEHYYEASSYRL